MKSRQDTRYALEGLPISSEEWLSSGKRIWFFRDGVYHVVGDGMHERTDGNIRENGVPEDPVNTSGVSENIFYQASENQ